MAILTDATVIPLGSRENTSQSIVMIPAKAEADKPGILCLQDVDDSAVVGEHYVWFDSAGLLRYHTTIPTDQNGSTAAIVATTLASITLDTAFDAGHYIAGSTATGAANAFSVGGTSTDDKVEIYHNNTDGYINSRKGDLYLSASVGGTLSVTAAQTNTVGIQSAAVSRTATATGGTTGVVADGTTFVTAVSVGATSVITLPTPTVGNVVWMTTGTTGVSVRSDDPTSVGINGGTGGSSAEIDCAASRLYRFVCQSATNWIASQFTNTGTESAVTAAST